jgi:Ca-activated chloride channel homolog
MLLTLTRTPLRATRWMALCLIAGCCLGLPLRWAHAQDLDAPRSKTESPYFFVNHADPAVDALPLKATQVDVRISGVIADVNVTQTYRNTGQRAIEAQYVFPGSTQAAVYGMTIRVGQRLITAQIREKQQAAAEYQSAKKEGKTAALLEQHRPNVFQMNVANILPGDEVTVQLNYTELLVPQAGRYPFVFPTVVGPRYSNPQAAKTDQSPKSSEPPVPPVAYLAQGKQTSAAFDIKVQLATPLGIQDIRSSSHDIAVQNDGAQRARVSLRNPANSASNRDFLLDYQLAGDQIQSGVMLYQGSHDNFFLAMVQPPKQVAARAISPREYIFVVDISGSMHGFPLNTAKALLRELIGDLKPTDQFNVLLFAGSNRLLSPQSLAATPANITQAIRTIEEMGGGGSTELMPALRQVYAQPKASPDTARTVVVVTDGFVTVEREAFELVRKNLSQANLFAFGIGSAVNRHLIEGLARAGMGEPFVITQAAQAGEQALRFRNMIASPVLTQVKARFDGLDVYDVQPLVLPDVLSERPVLVFGKWRGNPGGQLVVQGLSASGPYSQTLQIPTHLSLKGNNSDAAALRYLWARHRIASLSDQEGLEGGSPLRQTITELGLQYSLLTQYTSFLAVDQVVRNPSPGDTPTVAQPLPLPQDVSNLAVGAVVPGTPEPATWAAVLVMLSMLALWARRSRRAAHHRKSV